MHIILYHTNRDEWELLSSALTIYISSIVVSESKTRDYFVVVV